MISQYKKQGISVLGTGLVCLDIIKHNDRFSYLNGGSCGNVISSLAFLGVSTTIVKAQYKDYINSFINHNFKRLGVNIVEFEINDKLSPRIIEDIIENGNSKYHQFYVKCPVCYKELPSAVIIDKSDDYISKLIGNIDQYNLFYTDRASKGIRSIRNLFKRKNKWVFYEPNSIRNKNAFFENSLQADIVKFSSEKVSFNIASELRLSARSGDTKIIIITAGGEGAYFCSRKSIEDDFSNWERVPAYPIDEFRDASGAGDWCSAGIIYHLLETYKDTTEQLAYEDIYDAIDNAQKLSAASCSSEGAQGLIYDGDILRKFSQLNIKIPIEPKERHKLEMPYHGICPICLQPCFEEVLQREVCTVST
ncbi:PfkB family carbohydrate kinase [Acetivibrio cellulolyticus]|uniref:PfkB family carbohydrate kinase n=1 Tax=Acetivibrio cellulolyticus TaxID=35830 RepID=UPI0001E2F5E2|nr:PfkB family carbohydrate kinase [Acetivibrio cellulolyticus]